MITKQLKNLRPILFHTTRTIYYLDFFRINILQNPLYRNLYLTLENNNKLLDDNIKKKSFRNIPVWLIEPLETVKKSAFFIKTLLLLFFGFHFVRTFIFVTTNSILNSRLFTVFDSFFLYAGG